MTHTHLRDRVSKLVRFQAPFGKKQRQIDNHRGSNFKPQFPSKTADQYKIFSTQSQRKQEHGDLLSRSRYFSVNQLSKAAKAGVSGCSVCTEETCIFLKRATGA
jgi:hypothetical protein